MSFASVTRRSLLGAAALGAAPAWAAPSIEVWSAYEGRLRKRLDDSGGGRLDGAAARQLLDLTNLARRTAGARPVVWNDALAQAAQAHAADLAARGYVEHVSPEGFDPSHRLALLARDLVGSASENIAYRRFVRPATPDELMRLWRNSRPHWTNLLKASHTDAGFGVVRKGERTYAVGLYARPDGRLSSPLPFRISAEAEILKAARGAAFQSYGLADPMDETEVGVFNGEGGLTRLPRGAYQLRPRRPLDGRRVQVLWGPIFLRI